MSFLTTARCRIFADQCKSIEYWVGQAYNKGRIGLPVLWQDPLQVGCYFLFLVINRIYFRSSEDEGLAYG